MMTIQQIMREAEMLSVEERRELIKSLVDTLATETEIPKSSAAHRFMELRGLGKEIWEGIDAQEYVDQMRNEWDRPG